MRAVSSIDTVLTQSNGSLTGRWSKTSLTRSRMSPSISWRFFGATTPCTAGRCTSCLGGSMAMNIATSMNRGGVPMTMRGSGGEDLVVLVHRHDVSVARHRPERAEGAVGLVMGRGLVAQALVIGGPAPLPVEERVAEVAVDDEVEALLAACDQVTWTGRRDHAMLLLAGQTGLRISELIALTPADLHLGAGAHVVCHDKGRKDRTTPLTTGTRVVLRDWLAEHHTDPTQPLFPSRQGRALSRDAIERRISPYALLAAERCPSLHDKTVTAHVLRHTTAMRLLHAGVDTSVIALWLGHVNTETTQIYLHADMTLKEKALSRTRPPNSRRGRYQPPDTLLAWLEGSNYADLASAEPCPAGASPMTSA